MRTDWWTIGWGGVRSTTVRKGEGGNRVMSKGKYFDLAFTWIDAFIQINKVHTHTHTQTQGNTVKYVPGLRLRPVTEFFYVNQISNHFTATDAAILTFVCLLQGSIQGTF